MGLAPLELISAHPWQRAAFTTYALSLSFFEAVLLDALVRGGGREAVILADIKGIRAALSEQGARRVGKDYEVEPIAVTAGIFHPKISALTSEDECHLLVGSGNLTFGGWGANFEVLEHLHPSFAADAIEDGANFFDQLSDNARLRHGAGTLCTAIASDLRASVRGRTRNGNIRLLHSLDGAISQKLEQIVRDLGGAVRLVVAAPFWDNGAAIDRLCEAIGLDHVFVHAHAGGTVEGTAGSNWPARTDCTVHAVRLDVMREGKLRRLHGKVFEVTCKRGRLLLSGSANITTAALDVDRNIEACVARIQRGRTVGWKFSASNPLELQIATDEDTDDAEVNSGILRAVLEGDQIAGQVLTPRMSGPVSVFQLTTEGPEELGTTNLSADGTFRINTPSLEVQSWKSGRLVLRVQSTDGRYAEGFVSVAAFAEITRRAGAMGPRLLAVLTGTEMPADVAAIMSWFYEDPSRLVGELSAEVTSSTVDDFEESGPGPTISVAELNSSHAVPLNRNIGTDASGSVGWSRFMDFVFAAFRERRGPFGNTGAGRKDDDDQDDDFDGAKDATPIDPAVERSLVVFKRLFDLLLSPENAPRHAATAFDLTQYVCERLQPDIATAAHWLDRLIDVLIRINPPDRRADIVAAILTSLGAHPEPSDYRAARLRLLRLGVSISGQVPSADSTQGFQSVLLQVESFADMWTRLQTVRTFPEQARTYLADLEVGRASMDYVDLAREAPEEWPVLQEAFTSGEARERILVLDQWATACPRHYMTLPTSEIQKLRVTSIATAKNCCQRILICRGD